MPIDVDAILALLDELYPELQDMDDSSWGTALDPAWFHDGALHRALVEGSARKAEEGGAMVAKRP
jgi:hypothetical protein